MGASKKQLELLEKLRINRKPKSFEEADALIKEALSKDKKSLEEAKGRVLNSFPCYSQNYRDHNGTWKTVRLAIEELIKVRGAHRQHCIQILKECEDDYPNDRELQLAVFDKRCDKVFTWIQQALDEMVRQERK